MPTILFTGTLRPEWQGIKLDVRDPPLRISLTDSAGGACTLALLIGESQLSIVVRSDREVADLATFRNEIVSALRSVFDAIGYFYGQVITFEVASATLLERDELRVFLDKVQELADSVAERPVAVTALVPLAVNHRNLARAFADLRSAIAVPTDTAFFAFRAVEDIQQFFTSDEDNRSAAWALMRASLQIDRSWLKPLEEESKLARHGRPRSLTGSERVALLQRSWRVVDRFAVFLQNGSKDSLPAADFPLLKDGVV